MNEFEIAVTNVNNLTRTPTDTELLNLYGLYKQATVGDNNTPQPWSVNMRARAKWDAWNKRKGLDKVTAEMRYIRAAKRVVKKYG